MTGKIFYTDFFLWRPFFFFSVSGATQGRRAARGFIGTKSLWGFVPGAWGTPQRAVYGGTPYALLATKFAPTEKPDFATALPLLFCGTQLQTR